jgi:hypothetical protein
VVDRSDGAVIFYAEQTAPEGWVGAVREDDGNQLGVIRSQLEVVLPG